MAAVKLPDLVIELIEQIAFNLDPRELCNLRLSCRTLNQKSLHVFGKVCLRTLDVDLSASDLGRLQTLAECHTLASHVQTLRIKGRTNGLGSGFQWHRHEDGYLSGEQLCVQTMQDLLLSSFVNCRSFYVHSIVCDESLFNDEAVTPTDAIGIILGIIANTGLQVKSFSIDFRSQGFGRMDGSRLHMPQYLTPKFRSAWSDLEELVMEHSLIPETFDASLELLVQAKGLRKLTLNIGTDCSYSFLDRLATAKTLHGLVELNLYSLNLTAAQIDGLLEQSKDTLRSLSLWFLHLSREDDWHVILRSIQDNHPGLTYISVFWLTEDAGMPVLTRLTNHAVFPDLFNCARSKLCGEITINNKKHRGERRNFGANYEGKDASKALGAMADSIEFI